MTSSFFTEEVPQKTTIQKLTPMARGVRHLKTLYNLVSSEISLSSVPPNLHPSRLSRAAWYGV